MFSTPTDNLAPGSIPRKLSATAPTTILGLLGFVTSTQPTIADFSPETGFLLLF